VFSNRLVIWPVGRARPGSTPSIVRSSRIVRTISAPFETLSRPPVICASDAPLRRIEAWPIRPKVAVAAPEGEKSISQVSARTPAITSKLGTSG
jgi:hypothetical protein